MDKSLKVLLVSSEVSPFAKSGGLGDVAGALPKELLKNGVDVRVVLPKYKKIKEQFITNQEYVGSYDISLGWRQQSASVFKTDSPVPTYFIQNEYYFGRDGLYGYGDDVERFAFFSKACIELCGLIDFKPDVIHCNDWQTGLVPLYLKDFYNKFLFFTGIKTLYTIHNLQYQGYFGIDMLGNADLDRGYGNMDKLEFRGGWSFMKAGIMYSDAINTVSRTYANEIQTQSFGYGLEGMLCLRADSLYGITNGIDTTVYNPETDKHIYENYNAENAENKSLNKAKLQDELGLPVRDDVPLFAIVSRLVDQKGLDLVSGIMSEFMDKDVQLTVLGTGDGKYEHLFSSLKQRYPDKLSVNIMFDEALAQKIYAGSDFFLMPSLFEPCGLGQLIAMSYGTLPIVRKTGGLSDTVVHFDKDSLETGNGFCFEHYLLSGLMWAVNEALSVYADKNLMKKAIHNAMTADFSWKRSAEEYIDLYKRL